MLIHILIRGILLLIYCLWVGLYRKLQVFKKRQQCSPINDQILLQPATQIAKKIRRREVSSRIQIDFLELS